MECNIVTIKHDEKYCLLDTERNKLYSINEISYKIINHLLTEENPEQTASKFDISLNEIHGLMNSIGLLDKPVSYEKKSNALFDGKIERITLHVSNDCNLRCKYCYASGGSYGKSRGLMKHDTAKKFIDYCCVNFKRIENIVFFGGEPFLNYPIIEYICKGFYAKYKNGEIDHIPRFGAITNGTLLSEKIFHLISKYFSFITVSLDGPSSVNDLNRVYEDGKGSFDRVAIFIDRLKQIATLDLAIEATYTSQHIENGFTRAMTLDFLKSRFDTKVDIVDELSIENTIEEDINNPIESQKFQSILSILVRKKPIGKCEILRKIFAISTEGGIYPCHMNIGDGMEPISSIFDNAGDFAAFIDNCSTYQLKNNPTCHSCWAKNFCGGCSRQSFYNNETKAYSSIPNGKNCEEFKEIVKKELIRICEVRKDPILWKKLLDKADHSSSNQDYVG